MKPVVHEVELHEFIQKAFQIRLVKNLDDETVYHIMDLLTVHQDITRRLLTVLKAHESKIQVATDKNILNNPQG